MIQSLTVKGNGFRYAEFLQKGFSSNVMPV